MRTMVPDPRGVPREEVQVYLVQKTGYYPTLCLADGSTFAHQSEIIVTSNPHMTQVTVTFNIPEANNGPPPGDDDDTTT